MSDITVVISTSPRPSHPSTRIIDETIASIRSHLPDSEILVCCDGTNEENIAYEVFKDELGNRSDIAKLIVPVPRHQSGMMELALVGICTPLILYVEDDWEILPIIEWDVLNAAILSGQFNSIKLHAAPRIHPLHEEKMGELVRLSDETFVRRTKQWSQNPHLASTAFYREITEKYLKGHCSYIENIMVGHESFDHKLGVLNPCTGDMMRCRHLDGDQP